MKFPNKYLRNLKPYKLASHKIWLVSPEERSTVLKLDWNEATVPPSPHVKESIMRLLSEPNFFNLYPATNNETLLRLLADYVQLPIENVQYFASSDALHEYVCKVYISVGDPVMILGPSYDNFRLTCQANGAEVFFSSFEPDFSFLPEKFESEIRDIEPAVVYICNPNNPTGYHHSKEYIRHLLDSFPDTLFLIDEAYNEFAGETVKDLVLEYDNILISRTMSKAFALANFRVGYLIASEDNVKFVNRIRNPKNVSTIAQTAAIAALEDVNYMWNYVGQVREGKAYFEAFLKKYQDRITFFPSRGNFVLLRFSSQEEKTQMMGFLAEKRIFVRDTTQSPLVKNCFRITIGTKEQMSVVAAAFDSFYGC